MPKNQPDYQVRKFDLTKKRDLDTLSELAGDSVEANLAVGTGYFRIKRYRDALPHLEYAASLGSSDAKAHLAEMYYYGFGVDEDKGEALRLNVEAAEDGNLYSTYTLGMMYLRGVASGEEVPAGPERPRHVLHDRHMRGEGPGGGGEALCRGHGPRRQARLVQPGDPQGPEGGRRRGDDGPPEGQDAQALTGSA